MLEPMQCRAAHLILLVGIALLVGCVKDPNRPDPEPEIPENLRRLAVIDQTSRNVKVVDLDQGTVMETFALGERAQYVFAGASERYAYVVAHEANAVFVLDGGVWDESSGGALRLFMQAPRVLDFQITGLLPTHSMMNGHWFGTFLDGTGEAKLFDERTLLAGSPTTVTIPTARRHHGVAAPMDGAALVTIPPPAGSNRFSGIGLEAYSAAGERLRSFPNCGDPHGAAVRDLAFFGCAEGMLLVRRSGSEWSEVREPYPAQYAGRVITSAAGHPDLPYFAAYIKNLANPAQAAMLRVDAITATATTIEISGRGPSQEYAFDSAGRRLLVIGLNGDLHIFTASSLALEGTVAGAATAQPDPLPSSGVRWPTVVAGANFAYVADPATGRIAEVNLRTRQVTRRIEVGGSPLQIALLGTDRTGHGSITR